MKRKWSSKLPQPPNLSDEPPKGLVSIGFADFIDKTNPNDGRKKFMHILEEFEINTLVDLRVEPTISNPEKNRHLEAFDGDQLESACLDTELEKHDINYEYCGKVLGGVPGPQNVSEKYRGIFYNIQQPEAKHEVNRLLTMAKEKRIALMCYCRTDSWRACHRCVVMTEIRRSGGLPPIEAYNLIREENGECILAPFPSTFEYDKNLLNQQNRNVADGDEPWEQFQGEQRSIPKLTQKDVESTTDDDLKYSPKKVKT